SRGLTFATGAPSVPINNVIWTDSLFTTTSLASGLTTFAVSVDSLDANGAFVANGIHIPDPTKGFIVLLDYYGPRQDTFRLADMNNFQCGQTQPPVESFVPENSLSYLNYIFTGPCTDLSGTDDLVTSNTP